MNYEKAYKDALERARQFSEHPLQEDSGTIVEYIFPELKESEDERTRKEFCEDIWTYIPNEKAHKYIAWLEKQAEKPQGKTALEAINEEKVDNVNKVEPKFKVGDWIVNRGHSYLIADIDYLDNRYLFEIGGYTHEQLNWEYIELADKRYHLWSIQDAKDGDVLTWDDSKCIALFKNIYDEESFNSHGFVGHCTGAFESRLSYHDIEGAHPATKEQRDLLFAKMKEAGYEWDEEKKEQKKIVAPKFNIHDCVIKKHNSNINDFGYFIITDITDGKYWYNDRIICDITEQDEWELYEPVRQNSTWSEEDETGWTNTMIMIKEAASNHYTKDSIKLVVDWLNSLKDKCTWKPSDEQLKALHDINLTGNISYAGQGNTLIELYNDLKKLYDQRRRDN